MQILLFLLLFVTNVAYGAVDCGNPPTCAELGFSQTVQECTGRNILRCMLDMANDNAVYCGDAPAGDSSVPETPTCDLTVYYMNETMCSVEGVKCVQCENPEQSEYYMFDGCEDNYWQTSNIAEWCCHNDFNISGACPTGGNCSVCGNMNRLDSCEEGYHVDGNTCVADGIDCDEDYFNLMACPTNGNCEECKDLIGRTVYHLESCMTGYHRDGENDACCDSNLYNLDSCPVSEDEGTCASCGGKYRLIDCNTGWVKSGDDCLCDTSIYDMTTCPTGLDCEPCTDDVNGTINSFKGCLTGYHLNTAGDGCCNSSEYNIEGDCPENGNCNECGGKKKLTGCADGYHVEGNACVVDIELCNTTTYPLTSCPTNGNCNECEDTSMHYQLESCKTKYVVSGNICICDGGTYTVTGGCPTNGNCNSCTDQNGTKYELYACETGFVKSGDVCVCDDAEYPLATCPDNTVCKTCDDNHHKFVECNAGYWWDGDSCEQTCASLGFGLSSCPENGNCSDCTDDNGTKLKLDSCVTDYHVEGDVCVSDTVPCDTDVYNKTECPLNGTCNKCSDTTGDHFEFTGCNQGYEKNGEGCLCDTAIYPTTMCATNGNCTSCDDVSGTTRYKLDNCNSGYWKTDDGIGCCHNDFNLSECPAGGNCGGPCGGKYKFLECLDGYWWDGDSCEAVCNTTTYPLTSCPANGSCNECEDTSKHYQFNNCNDGYWLDGDSCEQTCASLGFNLSSCPENGTCTDCEDNTGTKYKVNDCDPNEYPLAACGSGAKCSVCTDTSDHYKFDECLSEYWLDGSNCKPLCDTSIYNIAGDCPANGVCDTCTDTSKHSWLKSCNSGYYKDGNACKPLCDTAEYNLDEGDCPTGGSCSSCTDPVNGTILKFDECGTGYHLNDASDGCCDSSEYSLSVKPEHASSESCGGKYKITGCNTGYVLSGDNCICDRNIYSLDENQCPSYGKCNSCTDLYGTYKQFTGCQTGYHLNDTGNGCCSSSTYSLSSCPDKGNCSSCGGKYKLDSCESPTTKSENSCICSTTDYPLTSCPENGVCNTTCEVNGVTRMKLDSCTTEYWKDGNDCKPTCESQGYILSSCPANGSCDTCADTSEWYLLDSCNPPYTKSGNSCICSGYPLDECPTGGNCSSCDGNYSFNGCTTGYHLNDTSDGCCNSSEYNLAECPENGNCDSCGGKYKLNSCDGSYVVDDGSCVCDTSKFTLGNSCITGGVCEVCTDTSDHYKFLYCDTGYYWTSHNCMPLCDTTVYTVIGACPDKAFCNQCVDTEQRQQVLFCQNGYYWDGDSCEQTCASQGYTLSSCPTNGNCSECEDTSKHYQLESCDSPYTKSENDCICSTTTYPLESCPDKATCSNCGTRYKIDSCATGYTKNAAGTACVTYCENAIASYSTASLLNSNSANNCGDSNKGICVLNNNISITDDSYYPSFTGSMRFEPCSTYDTGRSYNSNLELHGGLVDISGDTIFNVAVDAYDMATNGGHVYFNQNTNIEVMTMYDGNIFFGNDVTATIQNLSVEGSDLYVIVGENSSLDVKVNNNGNQITFGIISEMSSSVNINGDYFDYTYLSDDCQEVGDITVCKYDEGRVDAPGYEDFAN